MNTYGGFETFVREFVPRAIDVVPRAGRLLPPGPRGEQGVVGGRRRCVRTRGLDTMDLSTLSYGLTASWDVRRRDVDVDLVLNAANGFWLPLIRRTPVPISKYRIDVARLPEFLAGLASRRAAGA